MNKFKLCWVREDKQGSYDMGAFESREEAEAAIPAAKQELLDAQGSDPSMAEEIVSGSFQIEEEDDE